MSRYQKFKINLDFTEARDNEWQSAGLYASLHLAPDNHASTLPLSFLQTRCSSCRPTNSVKALLSLHSCLVYATHCFNHCTVQYMLLRAPSSYSCDAA